MNNKTTSYNQIIKATSFLGGAQFINIILGVIRTKIAAILLGTTGIGLIGIFQSIIDTTRSITCLGLDTGGIKEIATAESSMNPNDLPKTVFIFKKWFLWTALIGFFACIVFCLPISIWIFNDVKYAMHIAALAVCVFLATLATGRSVILQGMRQISYIAKISVFSILITIPVVVPLYYFCGVSGIIPALIGSSLIWFCCANHYYKKLKIRTITVDNKAVVEAGLNTLKLGLFIVLSTALSALSMLIIRTYLVKNIDIQATGLFQAVWVITNVYLSLILKSMGTDFFPRLCSIVDKRNKVRSLANEQTYVVMIVASPIIVGMLLLSEIILPVLYSSDFSEASSLLQWQVIGTFFKVIAWPIAFILLAKNKGLLHFATECLFFVIYLLLSFSFSPQLGLDAFGIGYVVAYIIYLVIIFILGRCVSGFAWSGTIVKIILINLFLIILCFYFIHFHAQNGYILCAIIFLLSLIYAYYNLKKVFNFEDLKNWFKPKKS